MELYWEVSTGLWTFKPLTLPLQFLQNRWRKGLDNTLLVHLEKNNCLMYRRPTSHSLWDFFGLFIIKPQMIYRRLCVPVYWRYSLPLTWKLLCKLTEDNRDSFEFKNCLHWKSRPTERLTKYLQWFVFVCRWSRTPSCNFRAHFNSSKSSAKCLVSEANVRLIIIIIIFIRYCRWFINLF